MVTVSDYKLVKWYARNIGNKYKRGEVAGELHIKPVIMHYEEVDDFMSCINEYVSDYLDMPMTVEWSKKYVVDGFVEGLDLQQTSVTYTISYLLYKDKESGAM